MRPYVGVSYKGRPYAGVSLLGGRGGRRGQTGPCKYRMVRCGECSWCAGRKDRARARQAEGAASMRRHPVLAVCFLVPWFAFWGWIFVCVLQAL